VTIVEMIRDKTNDRRWHRTSTMLKQCNEFCVGYTHKNSYL